MSSGKYDVQPWIGVAYRHIQDGANPDPLDFRFAGLGMDNRWNKQGLPALYLAGDRGIVVAEWGRHISLNLALAEFPLYQRAVFRLKIRLQSTIDLRIGRNVEAFGLSSSPMWFLDTEITQSIGEYIRDDTAAQAMVVPSIALSTISRGGIWSFSSTRFRTMQASGSLGLNRSAACNGAIHSGGSPPHPRNTQLGSSRIVAALAQLTLVPPVELADRCGRRLCIDWANADQVAAICGTAG